MYPSTSFPCSADVHGFFCQRVSQFRLHTSLTCAQLLPPKRCPFQCADVMDNFRRKVPAPATPNIFLGHLGGHTKFEPFQHFNSNLSDNTQNTQHRPLFFDVFGAYRELVRCHRASCTRRGSVVSARTCARLRRVRSRSRHSWKCHRCSMMRNCNCRCVSHLFR